jgi:CRP/FNR family transcriptional regulator, cyclic AMP receptor protein
VGPAQGAWWCLILIGTAVHRARFGRVESHPRPEFRGPFSVLGREEAAEFAGLGHLATYGTGDALLRQGDRSDLVHVIVAGRVRVVRLTRHGAEVLLALRGPGDVIGELAAIDPAPRSATVNAIENVSSLTITGGAFRGFLRGHPHLLLAITRTLVSRLRESDRRLVEGRVEDTRTRVARQLLELAVRYGRVADRGLDLDVPLSQEQLASWVGASREAVSLALRDLRASEGILTGRLRITIIDVDVVREAAFGVDPTRGSSRVGDS